ncbi:MolR family transcriptional regulator [Comamonas serinivorans]|uniref:MolR family transcriptional regulator n=1 Tax=Comamonas serinivorans TaxID=1082851 RepID=A0A1Y0ESR8_9BURK|nr:MolR family transcriptional regulator [Comamonas serinivorans]ARU06725.1 MolR family transcriptional regulator [Comamonas serinivorans]
MPSLYFDDPDEGLAPATSHPAFVQFAREAFWWDGADDFSPFGSDDGHDTLSSLVDWYREGGHGASAPVMPFLQQLLADWDFPVPADLLDRDDAAKAAWLQQDAMNDSYLASVCRARVATAFGQIKVSGRLDPEVREQALSALHTLLWLNERARSQFPDWPHADEDAQALRSMQAVLAQRTPSLAS